MSLLWRNRVYIAFSPERISLLKLGRGFVPKLLAHFDEAVVPLDSQPIWQAALDKLGQALAQPEWQGIEAAIVISNRLVRYAAVPVSSQLKRYPEQEAYARHVLTRTYGAAANQWDLRIQPAGKPDAPWLVCAVDQALLSGLRQICTAHRLRLNSVTPYLATVLNRYREAISIQPAWLVLNEPGCSLFALLNDSEFLAVSVVSHESINKLPMLLDRENLICAVSEPCKSVYLHASSKIDMTVLSKDGYEINSLEQVVPDGFPVITEGLYTMAYSGVL